MATVKLLRRGFDARAGVSFRKDRQKEAVCRRCLGAE
jgi:hypothetical protein